MEALAADLEVIFSDFTLDAVPALRRAPLVVPGRPDILDNLPDGRTHAEELAYLVGDIPPEHGLSVATGYVNLAGLHHLAAIIDEGRSLRLLLGALPERTAAARASARARAPSG